MWCCRVRAFALTRGGEGEAWLAKAVTSEPDVVWDWLVPGTDEDFFAQVVAAGDDALVGYWSDGSMHVTALDSEGKELWSLSPITKSGSIRLFRDSEIFVMRPYRFDAGAGIEARSTEDGKLAWWYPDGSARALTDAGVLFTGESDDEVTPDLGLLDTETGEVIWGATRTRG